MKTAIVGVAAFLSCSAAFAQRPTDPALLVPANAPALRYAPAPKAFDLPDGVTMGPPASVAFDSKGHMFVLTRGDKTFFEFDENGAFIRAFGDKLFTRSHGLRIDRDDNLWATDVGAHVVVKFNPRGGNGLGRVRRGTYGGREPEGRDLCRGYRECGAYEIRQAMKKKRISRQERQVRQGRMNTF